MSDRWRREDHSLALEDLDDALDELPGRLVLGAGAHSQLRPDRAASAELRRRGVQVECPPTTRRCAVTASSTNAAPRPRYT